jgi:hypothetical protein
LTSPRSQEAGDDFPDWLRAMAARPELAAHGDYLARLARRVEKGRRRQAERAAKGDRER